MHLCVRRFLVTTAINGTRTIAADNTRFAALGRRLNCFAMPRSLITRRAGLSKPSYCDPECNTRVRRFD
jgi:hypothetical protein